MNENIMLEVINNNISYSNAILQLNKNMNLDLCKYILFMNIHKFIQTPLQVPSLPDLTQVLLSNNAKF